MQVNSINNQNSFGLNISSLLKSELDAHSYLLKHARKTGLIKGGQSFAQNAKTLREIKKMFPGDTLDIKMVVGKTPVHVPGFFFKSDKQIDELALSQFPDYLIETVTLKRKNMPDKEVLRYPLYRLDLLSDILNSLKKIQESVSKSAKH